MIEYLLTLMSCLKWDGGFLRVDYRVSDLRRQRIDLAKGFRPCDYPYRGRCSPSAPLMTMADPRGGTISPSIVQPRMRNERLLRVHHSPEADG